MEAHQEISKQSESTSGQLNANCWECQSKPAIETARYVKVLNQNSPGICSKTTLKWSPNFALYNYNIKAISISNCLESSLFQSQTI